MQKEKINTYKVYNTNKKAKYDYEIIEKFEVGIVLQGPEVKSIRSSSVNLSGSYIISKDKKLSLVQAHISKPSHIGVTKFEETRDIFLLVSKRERLKIEKELKVKGITLVPLKIYQPENSKNIKLEIALVQGKNNYDKRVSLKEKTLERETKQLMKGY